MEGQFTLDQIEAALQRRRRKAWGEFPELGVDTVIALTAELRKRDALVPEPVDALEKAVTALINGGDLAAAKKLLSRVNELGKNLHGMLKVAIEKAERELEKAKGDKGGEAS